MKGGIERSSASEGVERIERTRASRTADARFERRRGIDDADADADARGRCACVVFRES